MPVKVSFKVGSSARLGKSASLEEGIDRFMTALGDEIGQRAEDAVRVDVRSLTTTLSDRVGKSLTTAVNYAAKNMIGIKSATGASPTDTRIAFDWQEPINPIVNAPTGKALDAFSRKTGALLGEQGSISWKALAPATLKKKAGVHSRLKRRGEVTGMSQEQARQFFKYSGKLQAELLKLAQNITSKTGTVQVGYIKKDAKRYNAYKSKARHVNVGQLRLTFVPKIQLRTLPGLQTGDVSNVDFNQLFERSLGISADSLEKLKGTDYRQRPMLQPIFTYWILNRIPRLVATTVRNSMK